MQRQGFGEMEMNETLKDTQFKDLVTLEWCRRMEEAYPNHRGRLRMEDCLEYFHLITELDIPVEKHPANGMIVEWCKSMAEFDVHVEHALHCSCMWTEAFFDIMKAQHVPVSIATDAILQMCTRIHWVEREISRNLWMQTMDKLKQMNEKINELHDDRLNIIGKMAASMAHELRNPLTSIGGFLKLIRSKLDEDSLQQVGGYLDVIENEFDSFQMQITGFLSFSQKQVIEESMNIVDAKILVQSILTLIQPRLINENIRIDILLEDHVVVKVQKSGIQQVLSNLLNNSIDALIGIKDPRIVIAAYSEGDSCYMTVSNNGPKIPEDFSRTIFSPFVTNKRHGTGLGLAICKQIMNKNSGTIHFTSTDEETRFILGFKRP
jgi:two-component system, sporulation sensor kinase D